jgi:hypothetical protein
MLAPSSSTDGRALWDVGSPLTDQGLDAVAASSRLER